MTDGGVDYLIYLGQEKAIIWAYVIQIGVINIDSPPYIFL